MKKKGLGEFIKVYDIADLSREMNNAITLLKSSPLKRKGNNLLCKIGFHRYSEWKTHPFFANKITRQCLKCFSHQDRRLF